MIWLILILATILRLVSLNQSFWLDEATSGIVARDMNLSQLFTFIRGDFHPPLYYLLLSGWGRVFGYSEISLRMPSVIFAIGTIYFLYLIVENLKIDLKTTEQTTKIIVGEKEKELEKLRKMALQSSDYTWFYVGSGFLGGVLVTILGAWAMGQASK